MNCLDSITSFFQNNLRGNEDTTSSRIALCITSEEVHNQKSIMGTYSSLRNPFKSIKGKKDSKMKVVCKTVANLEEINIFAKKMKDQNNELCGLIIRAHGTPFAIILSKTEYTLENKSFLYERNIKSLQPTFSLLEKDAAVILQCCSTGKIIDDEAPIARTICKIAKKTVYAPTDDVNELGSDINVRANTISAKFRGQIKSHATSLLSSLLDLIYKILFIGCLIGQDITAKFEYEKSTA